MRTSIDASALLAHWGDDPATAEYERLIDESDRMNGEQTAVTDAMMATPATSAAGILAKMRVAVEIWPPGRPHEDTEYHEDVALAFMRDAVRLLGGAEVLS